jgi:tetratricopeptide (TPR) repeat protein
MYQEAISDFTRVLELDNGNANAYFNRASTFDSQGAVAQAIADYSMALELDSRASEGGAAGKAPQRGIVPPTPGGF